MIELRAQLEKQLVCNLDRRTCDCYGVPQHQAFDIREHRARFVFVQCPEFLVRHALLSADRRPDIDSERATDDHGDFDLGQCFELSRHGLDGLLPQFHVGQRP